jgi:hypothetical protein
MIGSPLFSQKPDEIVVIPGFGYDNNDIFDIGGYQTVNWQKLLGYQMAIREVDPSMAILKMDNSQMAKIGAIVNEQSRRRFSQVKEDIVRDIALGKISLRDPGVEDRLVAENAAIGPINFRELQAEIKDALPSILDSKQLAIARDLAIDRVLTKVSLQDICEGPIFMSGLNLTVEEQAELTKRLWKVTVEFDAKIAALRREAWDKAFQELPKEEREKLEQYFLIDGLVKQNP